MLHRTMWMWSSPYELHYLFINAKEENTVKMNLQNMLIEMKVILNNMCKHVNVNCMYIIDTEIQ